MARGGLHGEISERDCGDLMVILDHIADGMAVSMGSIRNVTSETHHEA